VTPLGDYSMESLVEKWSITTEDAYRHVTMHTLLQGPATAEEVASCCLFLVCDESAIVTGRRSPFARRGPDRHEVGVGVG
jgi:meso-butanediol dehydrogenase/(S,S)-butanediol dehydrogenase/diacetyl reductase